MPKRGRDADEEEPRSSKRVRLPPLKDYLDTANKAQQRIEYKRSLISAYAGSAKAVAYLGPLSVRSVNSDAVSSKPSGIIAAREKYPAAYFKAGHMINAMFGGNGESVTISPFLPAVRIRA